VRARGGRLSSAGLAPVFLRLRHCLTEQVGASVAEGGNQRPYCAVRALIKQNRQEDLEEQGRDPHYNATLDGGALQERCRIFKRDHEEGQDDAHDLNNREFDNQHDEYLCAGRRLQASGCTEYTTNEVPEELAVEKAPEAGPDGVDTSGHGDVACVFVPDKFPHCVLKSEVGELWPESCCQRE